MSLWNDRFKEKGWETVQIYAQAKRAGFCVEALAMSVNILKANLVVALEMEYLKRGKTKKNIGRTLKRNRDVGELIKLSKDISLFNDDENKKLDSFWKNRNYTLHNYIDGKIEYDEVCSAVQDFAKIMSFVQGSFMSYKVVSTDEIAK